MSRNLSVPLVVWLVLALLAQAGLPGAAVSAAPVGAESERAAPEIAQPAATPVAVPRPFDSPLPTPAPRGRLTLSLTADPAWAEPGQVVTFTATASNLGTAPLMAVALTDTLPWPGRQDRPDGLIYVAQSAVGFSYNPSARQLIWAAGELAAGAVISGSFQARVQGLAIGETVTNTVSATAAGLAAPVTAAAEIEVVPPAANEMRATPGAGGWLRSTDGRVDLRVPPGAVNRPLRFSYASRAEMPAPPPNARFAFSLDAADEAAQAMHQFSAPLTLTVAYDARQVTTPGLAYYDEATQRWLPVEAAVVRRGQLQARLTHLTIFVVTSTGARLEMEPATQVRAAQPALYSRGITYQYPFALPPGRAGLAPILGLAYNSANHSLDAGHFSSVGHGWELLGADYVERRPNPAHGEWYDVTLHLRGQTYTLVHSGARAAFPIGAWYAKETPALKIYYDEFNNTDGNFRIFKIWTADGTRYEFKGNVKLVGESTRPSLSVQPPATNKWREDSNGVYCAGAADADWLRLPLVQVQDTYTNSIDYTWASENSWQQGAWGGRDSKAYTRPGSACGYVRAIRLKSVSYNGGRVQIALDYGESQPADRWDRPEFFDQTNTYSYFSIYRLRNVTVQAKAKDSQILDPVRTYSVTHASQAPSPLAPSQVLLRLDQIREAAGGPARTTGLAYTKTAMSTPTEYDYLKRVANPLGGKVEFTATLRIGGQPYVLTQRSEVDDVTGQQAMWTYDSAGWSDPAHGYARVWVILPDNSVEVHEFEQNPTDAPCVPLPGSTDPSQAHCPKAGREWQVRVCSTYNAAQDICTGELGSTTMVNAAEKVPSPASLPLETEYDRPWFVYTQEVQHYETGSGGRVALGKTRYAYEPAMQAGPAGARQYGNLTRSEEYEGIGGLSFAAAPLRTTTTRYYANDTAWIVNKPALTQVYTGTTSLFAERRIYYDDNANNAAAPSQGRLTRDEQAPVVGGAVSGQVIAKTYKYFANGNLEWVKDESLNQTKFFWDSWFGAFQTCVENAAGQRSKTTYYGVPGDGACNTTNGSALTTPGAAFGQVEQAEDANGVKSRTAYDGLGRPQTVTLAAGTTDQAIQSYSYRPFAGIGLNAPFWVHAQQQDNAGGDNTLHSWTFYDGFGRAIETQAEADGGQHIESYRSYTFRDAPERESPPLLKPGSVTTSATYTPIPTGTWPSQLHTRYAYDKLGRPTTVTFPDSKVQTTSYTAEGRSTGARAVTTAVDEKGRQSKTEQDAFGRLRTSIVYSGTTPVSAGYDYNVADQLTTVVAPGNLVAIVGYDGLGRKASVSDPDLGLWRYTYDNPGNLKTQTDARGVTLWFGYDSLNRLTEKRLTDVSGDLLDKYIYDEVQTGYSNLGRRTRAEAYESRASLNGGAVLTHTLATSYDGLGRLRRETRTLDGQSYVTSYLYDPLNRVVGITYPGDEQVTTVYGAQGQPTALVSSLFGALADSASYDAASRLTSLRYPAGNNLIRRQVYYPWDQQRGRLQSLLVGTTATTADRLNLAYSYDAVGNVQSISDNGVPSNFGYDGLYQLTAAYGQNFSYDAAGRIVNFNGLAYTPDSAHPHAVNLVNGIDRYDYDPNGNLAVRNKGVTGQEQALSWNAENRLSAVTYPDQAPAGSGSGGSGAPGTRRIYLPLIPNRRTPAERYSYDADGARVRKETKTEITRMIGPHYEVVVSVASGQVLTTTKYYQFGGQRIAVRQNGALSYLHGDHLGSTSVATNTGGTATSNARYDAYGSQRSGNLFALPTDHAFTGQKLDRGTGLMYYGARYFDGALGTFLSPDSIVPNPGNPQALNRYAYVNNNPLKYTDPTGHFWWIAAGAVVGAAVAYGSQVVGNLDQGMDLGAALTTNINGTAIVAGALIGATTVAMAPVAVAMAGEVLMGAGLLTGSTGIFSAGMSVGGVASSMAAAVYGVSAVEGQAAASVTRAAGPESEYKTSASDVNWSRIGKTPAGGTLWGSDRRIQDADAYQLTDELSGTGSKHVSLLSGTHGNSSGATGVEASHLAAKGFYYDDVAHYSGTANVRVLDMTATSIMQLRALTGQVVCAWCWSDRSTLIQSLTGG